MEESVEHRRPATLPARSHSMTNTISGGVSSSANFDPFKHQPPRIDQFGWNKTVNKKPGDDGSNVLRMGVRIPEWWSKPGIRDEDKQTNTKLTEKRRQERVPHISYDLDGDGFVGGRDFVIAKHFDKDMDGILNAHEKQNALEAVKNGYEKNFIWNVEVSGGARPYRLLQKRGVIVDAEDFLPVRDTYPVHPNTLIKPKVNDYKELQAVRKKDYKDAIDAQKAAWEKANPPSVEVKHIQSEYLINNPKFNSIHQRKEQEKEEARKKAGLEDRFKDVKITTKDPGLGFIDQPKTISKTLLENQRKEEMLNELKKLDRNLESHKDCKQRIDEREACHLRLGYKESSGLTFGQIHEERKKQMIDNMTKKFGNVTVGIHGQELPKFADQNDTKEYWKFSKTHNDDFKGKSSLEMKEHNKWWAKNDDVRIADVKEEWAPIDPFKSTYVEKKRNDMVQDKLQNMNHWRNSQDDAKEIQFMRGHNKVTKWSEQEKFQRCKGEERLFDKIIKNAEAYEKNIEQVEKDRQAVKEAYMSKISPLKNNQGQNVIAGGGLDSSRANQSFAQGKNMYGRGDQESGAQEASHKNQMTSSKINLSGGIHDQSSVLSPNNQTKLQGGLNTLQNSIANNNMSGLSMVGKSTLFSRVAASPQAMDKVPLIKQSKGAGNKNEGKNNSSIQASNNQSTTINQSTLNNTQINNTVLSSLTFKDTVQRGVLSGIGFLKK